MRPILMIAAVLAFSGPVTDADSPSESRAMITLRGRLIAEYLTSVRIAVRELNARVNEMRDLNYVAEKTDTGWVVAAGKPSADGTAFLIEEEVRLQLDQREPLIKKNQPPLADKSSIYLASKAIGVVSRNFLKEHGLQAEIVVLPAGSENYVYILTARAIRGGYLFGRDARYLISSDSSKILETHWMHKSILEFDEGTEGHKAVAGVHTHLQTDAPEESDVAYVLLRKPSVPEFIRAKNRTFIVEPDGTIRSK